MTAVDRDPFGVVLDIEFSVVGTPIPQGSTRAFAIRRGPAAGKIITTNDPTGSIGKWRGDIRTAVGRVKPLMPVEGPVRMGLVFRFRRPASHFLPANARRTEPELRAEAPRQLAAGPDLDKLVRAVLDALTAVVYVDDSQVVRIDATKRYAGGEEQPGVSVRLVAP